MTKKVDKITYFKNAITFSTYLLLIWGFYRLLFKLPEEIEELVIKPLVWLIPLIYYLRKEKESISSIGITTKKLFPAIYLSLGLGFLFLAESIALNYTKYGAFNFGAFIGKNAFVLSICLSLATAISEELVFRGFIFTRIWKAVGSEWFANFLTSTIWMLIHVPVVFFVLKLSPSAAVVQLLLTSIYGVGSALIFARTGNIVSSIILHLMWEWPIILFR